MYQSDRKKIKIKIRIKIRIKSRMGIHEPDKAKSMKESQETCFGHENLEVYREAIRFVAWLSVILDEMDRIGDTRDQLERASTSVCLNIAEGNGKYTIKDRCRFFDIANGSAL